MVNSWMDLWSVPGSGHRGVADISLGILVSFVLAQAVAWAYSLTFYGFSYSRGFVQALVLGAIVAATMIASIGNSVAVSLGVIGALAIIRFRTQIRDPRDIIFLFASLAIGIACGAGAYHVAAVGTVAFIAAVGYLHLAPQAALRSYDALLRFMTAEAEVDLEQVERILQECCTKMQLASVREALEGTGKEFAYEVRLRDPSYQAEIVDRLNRLPQIADAHLIMHRATVEI